MGDKIFQGVQTFQGVQIFQAKMHWGVHFLGGPFISLQATGWLGAPHKLNEKWRFAQSSPINCWS